MRIIKLLLIFLFTSCFVYAQHSAYKPTGEKYRKMVDSKLKAVYTGNPAFDSLFVTYVKEVFVVKPVEFISAEDFETQRTNVDYSFIVPIEITIKYYDNKQATITFYGPPKKDRVDEFFVLAYLQGSKKKILKKDLHPSNYISYGNFDPSLPKDYLVASNYRLKNMIQQLYQTIEILEKTGESKFFSNPSKYLKTVYNAKNQRIKEKELIVCQNTISFQERDFKKVYPYKFKILDRESYKKEIEENKEGQCYLYMNSIAEVFVVDSYTGEIILETSFKLEPMKLMSNPNSMFQLSDKQLSEIVKMIK
jgi:hypothetical protein